MPRGDSFFGNIPQFDGKAGNFRFPVPIFYYDMSALFVVMTASSSTIKKWMPSPRMKHFSAFPSKAVIVLGAFKYIDTDIGPYNEFSVTVPVSLDGLPIPGSSWLKGIAEPRMFITHLPVTTEIANVAGREIYNFPKFVDKIEFNESEREISVTIGEGANTILTLTAPQQNSGRTMSQKVNMITSKGDRLLRSEVIMKATEMGVGIGGSGVKLSLGEKHFMANDLRDMKIGGALAVVHVKRATMTLTAPLESFDVTK